MGLTKIWSGELLWISWTKVLINYYNLPNYWVTRYMAVLVVSCESCSISISEPYLVFLLKRDCSSLFIVRGKLAILESARVTKWNFTFTQGKVGMLYAVWCLLPNKKGDTKLLRRLAVGGWRLSQILGMVAEWFQDESRVQFEDS